MTAIEDHAEIYLQPTCCADEDVGRLWCEDADPEDCEDGKHWTRYVRADIHEAAIAEAEQLRARVAELEAICENVPEGCTPADARVLREANHALADEVARAKWHKDIAEAALASVEQERDELRRQGDALMGHGEAVAFVGDAYSLHWIGSGPIAPIIERTGLKPGDKLYTQAHAVDDGVMKDAERYRTYRRLVFTEPAKMAKILAPCKNSEQIDAAIDSLKGEG